MAERWKPTGKSDYDLKRLDALLGRWPIFYPDRLVTTATTVLDSDETMLVDTTSGAVTVTLPTASTVRGREFTVVKTNAGANNVTIAAAGSDTINGAATYVFNTQWQSITVQCALMTSPATYSWFIR